MPAGRPPTYQAETMCALVREYTENFADYDDVIPQIAGLRKIIPVSVSTLYRWEEQHPEFREVLEDLRNAQHNVLVNKGLDGTFNAPITKLILHKHGHSDKTETELTGAGGGPVEWQVLPVAANPGSGKATPPADDT